MTLNSFFHNCENKSSHLFREFIWILTEKFSLDEAKLISGQHLLSSEEQQVLLEWCEKKKQDYPLQYFIGSTDFLGQNFVVSEGVLIPRMETEEIADWVTRHPKALKAKNLMDIGSGSGCLGIGVGLKLPNLKKMVLLEPYGDDALEKNARRLCENKNFKIEILKKTFEEFEFSEKFDLILSNPPYIRYSDPDVANGVYEHEPHEALFGGESGWEKVVAWVEKSYTWLTENGLLVFEISHDQRQTVEEHLSKYKPVVHKDSFGKDRFFVIEYRGEVSNG